MRCVLIYNPVSGRSRNQRVDQLQRASDALTSQGHEVVLIATTSAGSATKQTRQAVRDGAQVVFACGGDGTIHEVIQGLASETGEPTATLAILPLGSANALARHLGLSLTPEIAALQSIQGATHTIPIGKIIYREQSRYFIVMAGAGPDGMLVYRMLTAQKSILGRVAYYLHAARIFATYSFPRFDVTFLDAESKIPQSHKIIGLMAVRVDDLGGLFSRLVRRNTSVHQSSLELIVLRSPALLSLPLWFVFGWFGLHQLNPFLKFAKVSSFSCQPSSETATHFQADGEWIGHIPVTVSLIPNALRVLIPTRPFHPNEPSG